MAGLGKDKNKYDFVSFCHFLNPSTCTSLPSSDELTKGKHPRNSEKLLSLYVTYDYLRVLSFLCRLNLQPTQLPALYSTLLPLTDGSQNHIFQTIRNIISWKIMHRTFVHFHGLKLTIWRADWGKEMLAIFRCRIYLPISYPKIWSLRCTGL